MCSGLHVFHVGIFGGFGASCARIKAREPNIWVWFGGLWIVADFWVLVLLALA